MKKTIYVTLVACGLLLLAGMRSARQKWEYACFVDLKEQAYQWKEAGRSVEGKSIIELCEKLNIKQAKFVCPVEYPIFEYAGNSGWELVQCCSENDTVMGTRITWFRRTK